MAVHDPKHRGGTICAEWRIVTVDEVQCVDEVVGRRWNVDVKWMVMLVEC